MVNFSNDLEKMLAIYLAKAKKITTEMRVAVKDEQTERLSALTENRDRLYSLLKDMLDCFMQNNNNSLPRELQILIHQLTHEEEILLRELESLKDKIQIEISTAFKNKESHKAFNLNSVK
jgi:hypothetical protein